MTPSNRPTWNWFSPSGFICSSNFTWNRLNPRAIIDFTLDGVATSQANPLNSAALENGKFSAVLPDYSDSAWIPLNFHWHIRAEPTLRICPTHAHNVISLHWQTLFSDWMNISSDFHCMRTASESLDCSRCVESHVNRTANSWIEQFGVVWTDRYTRKFASPLNTRIGRNTRRIKQHRIKGKSETQSTHKSWPMQRRKKTFSCLFRIWLVSHVGTDNVPEHSQSTHIRPSIRECDVICCCCSCNSAHNCVIRFSPPSFICASNRWTNSISPEITVNFPGCLPLSGCHTFSSSIQAMRAYF